MARVRIYEPAKSAMQSGQAGRGWVLEFVVEAPRAVDPLMGWVGGSDTQSQVRLFFPTRDEAQAYAARNGLTVELELKAPVRRPPKSYADNFRFGRAENWTH